MTSERDERAMPPENEAPQQADPDGQAVTMENLSEFAEWLEARLDALDTRLDRFGRSIFDNHEALREMVREEISAALIGEHRRVVRMERRRMLWTIAVLITFAAALVLTVLWGLDMLP